jgi:hypothetical protein
MLTIFESMTSISAPGTISLAIRADWQVPLIADERWMDTMLFVESRV